eukprot:1191101-Prorocentrum_minimum.AAC.1
MDDQHRHEGEGVSKEAELRVSASGKLHLLHLMLEHLKKGGHRVLLFSQWTRMLDIVEDFARHAFGRGAYERVDGAMAAAARQVYPKP